VIYYKSKSADAVIIPEWKQSLMDDEWLSGGILSNSKIAETENQEKWKTSLPMISNGFIRIKAVINLSE
jgi:hypothetical protein